MRYFVCFFFCDVGKGYKREQDEGIIISFQRVKVMSVLGFEVEKYMYYLSFQRFCRKIELKIQLNILIITAGFQDKDLGLIIQLF